ncbi:hypothetical protein [Legionella fallonii]|uniref:Putative substrate of the Dot/Icm secretion system [5 coiled coil domains] n=1 Tax=Legionella fallonii LLAP-10 TaxID=1212491 RepID=A0A098G529_9GAMM|nr:hypothetical protein [Legionella fallonii]CEG57577.1 putative substrate of the Dot/Icm secretion system [5 coiled coil domains] [Legionella fallonii LLAP-10]
MALSDIIISDLVLKQTNAAISESNYHGLRQYLLERKPLLTVTNAINSLLSEQISIERQEFIQKHTQLACEAQRNNDIQEVAADEQEQINDNLLHESYAKELPVLERTMSQLDVKCFVQQGHFERLHSERQELKVNLEQVGQALERNRNERQILSNRYLYGIQFPQGTVHTHPSTVIYPQPYANSGLVLSLQDQIIWDRLLNEENRLNAEQQRLDSLADSKEGEYKRGEQKLNGLLSEKKYAEERYSEVKRQIEFVLPNKEQQRQIRSQERFHRDVARKQDDFTLQQLSPKNQERLRQLIATQDYAQENQRSALMSQVFKTSYSVFTSQLELTLQQGGASKIKFSEREALKTIIEIMKNCNQMEEKEQEINQSLRKEKEQLRMLQQNLADSNEQLRQFITSKPLLIKENERLKEENKQLALSSESAAFHRANSFYSSLFGISCGLISAGIINGAILLNPILLTIPGAFAIVAVVSVIIAIVAHCKKSSNDEQVENNKKIISENESTIFDECKKANDISEVTIPNINAQIEQTANTIALIEQELQQHHQAMSQLLHKAQNVTGAQGKNNVFFLKAGNIDPQAQPSAPIYDESIDDIDSGVGFGNGLR